MLTAFFIFWPLVSILMVLLWGGRNARWATLLSAIVQLGVTLYALGSFNPAGGIQELLDYPWVPQFGIHFKIGMDGVSMLMVLLTNLVFPLIILSSWHHTYEKPRLFYSLALLMQAALVGVFVSLDGFLYYIFWELALVPIYLITLLWGGENRGRITFKFFIYTLLGSLFMLVAFIFLYLNTDPHSFDIKALSGLSLPLNTQRWIFWAFFLAFAIKMPLFPFHTWQPDTYTTSPAQGTMLLSGIMLKMGIYSVFRWLLPIAPDAVTAYRDLAVILGVTGVVYASWIALTQKDMKRLFAYSSIAHVGLIAAGLFTPTMQGVQGAMIQMLSHGLYVVGLFFIAQIIFDRTGTFDVRKLGGIINRAPVFATVFLIILLCSVALPLTSGFVGEFLLLSGLFQYNPWFCAFAALTIILGAVYMLRTYQLSMLGDTNSEMATFSDLRTSELMVLAIIAGLVLFLGVYPKPILDLTGPSVQSMLEVYKQNLTLY